MKSSPTRNIHLINESLTDKVKKMTVPDDVPDSARRRMVRRNSLGSHRIVTFSKPSPERNSVSSTRSIKEYTTTQSCKELSIESSQAEDDEVTSKAMITKTSSILRTPKSNPAKTFTSRNRLETPKTSYNRTNRAEVFFGIDSLCSKILLINLFSNAIVLNYRYSFIAHFYFLAVTCICILQFYMSCYICLNKCLNIH